MLPGSNRERERERDGEKGKETRKISKTEKTKLEWGVRHVAHFFLKMAPKLEHVCYFFRRFTLWKKNKVSVLEYQLIDK